MYDAIIVGARCAGSATALLLARSGLRVLLVDRATFPSDTISGHFIFHPGSLRLKRWGLLDKVLASNCPPISHFTFDLGDFPLTGDVPFIEGAPAALGPRRTVLDTILLEAAAEAGAEIRQGFSVTGLLRECEHIVGIQGQGRDGVSVQEKGRIVIGADGKHSKIAEWVGAPVYRAVPSFTCWYYAYWNDLPSEGLELNWHQHRLFLTFPTNDGLTMSALALPQAEFHDFRSDIEGNYQRAADLFPALAERMHHAKRADRFYGMADLPGFFRKPYGPGWALVGDAGHHKDPTPAFGISDAFCDAELLTEAILNIVGGKATPPDALAQYEETRNARAIPDYEMTNQMAQLVGWDSPESLFLRAALRDNAEACTHFFAVRARALPNESFFSPENLQRVMQPKEPVLT